MLADAAPRRAAPVYDPLRTFVVGGESDLDLFSCHELDREHELLSETGPLLLPELPIRCQLTQLIYFEKETKTIPTQLFQRETRSRLI